MAHTPKFNNLFSLLFPPQCVCCRTQIRCNDWAVSECSRSAISGVPPADSGTRDARREFASHWCEDCWGQLPDFDQIGCPTCSAVIPRPAAFGDRCAICLRADFKFTQCVALGNYEGLLKQLVVSFKGNYEEQLAIQLGKLLGYQLERYDFLPQVDFLLPVPTHWRRRLKRGFHGAGVVGEGVRAVTRVPVNNSLLSCKKLTQKQGMLSEPQRFANVKGGFQLNHWANVEGATIMLIDDVMTSGATLSEAANVLLKSGAKQVYAAVVARGTRSR